MEYINVNANKQRDIALDIICGVLIIRMILAHIVINMNSLDWPWFECVYKITFFLMPWFFFKNGMFFHPKEDDLSLLKQDFKRLVKPFIIWSIIGECVRFIDVALSEHAGMWQWYAGSIKTFFITGCFDGNSPLWFLWSLFIVRILFNIIVRHKSLVGPVMVASVIIPFACWKFGLNQLPVIPHTIAGLFYFSCGYYLKILQKNRQVIAISGIILYVFTLISPSNIAMIVNNVWNGDYYTAAVIRAVAAIIVVNSFYPPQHAPGPVFKLLAYIGRNSMSYYVTHYVLLLIMNIILVRLLGISDPMIVFFSMAAACILLLPIIVRVLKRKTKLLS